MQLPPDDMPVLHTDAEAQGEAAHAAGKGPFPSPYKLDTPLDRHWRRGWMRAMRRED